ncbi:MAG: tyrosine-type recombinase/integrase [Acidimicrobiaceae bacterium]|nr:tyrosine-type recombinase/integrase [Acidimicrobiaceae bacterium]
MLSGWGLQQTSRMLAADTIKGRLDIVSRFQGYTNASPWEWNPTDLEDWTSFLLGAGRSRAHSTIRGYQNAIRLFMEFITDSRYGWLEECSHRFGEVPQQICHEWNTVEHLSEFEGRPQVRPFTYEELEVFFGRCDERVEEIRRRGRKGSLVALRDSQMFKTYYAWGLRRNENIRLDIVDLRRNPIKSDWGKYGALNVRYGKAVKGSPPRRRTVLSVPHFDWAIDGLRSYIEEVRPAFGPSQHPALWITERQSRVSKDYVDKRFAKIRNEAGLPKELHLHCLRHSYVTHLIEFGYDERFVQEQVGHAYASTTAIYAGVSSDYKNNMLGRALEKLYVQSKEKP